MQRITDKAVLGDRVIRTAVTRRAYEKAAENIPVDEVKRAVGRFKKSDQEFTTAVDAFVQAGGPQP